MYFKTQSIKNQLQNMSRLLNFSKAHPHHITKNMSPTSYTSAKTYPEITSPKAVFPQQKFAVCTKDWCLEKREDVNKKAKVLKSFKAML